MKQNDWRPRAWWTALSIMAAAILGEPSAWAVPNLQFSSPNVAISQVTPGGSVALFYVGHEWQEPLVHRGSTCQLLTDPDDDGSISFTYGSELANQGVWVAVDLANGSVTVGSPNGIQPTEATVAVEKLIEDSGFVDDSRQSLHLLVVRPGIGAWQGSSFDGAASDFGSPDDGRVKLKLSKMTSLASGAAWFNKAKIQSGDVLVGLDPEFLTYYAVIAP